MEVLVQFSHENCIDRGVPWAQPGIESCEYFLALQISPWAQLHQAGQMLVALQQGPC